MSQQDIISLITWGPVLLFLVIFLVGLISGMIKGNRKVIRRLIYVILFTTLVCVFTPMLTKLLMGVSINGVTVEGYINEFISTNETMRDIFDNIPALEDIIKEFPASFASLFVFFILIVLGLPLSFPIYWLYMAIYALISKVVFRYSRFKRDENGKILRNEKGKKIKKEKKCRVVAGVVRGTQYVAVTALALTPVGFVSRVYKEAKDSTENKTLTDISYLENYGSYLELIDAYNKGFIGYVSDNPLSKAIASYLMQLENNGEKTDVEKEVVSLVKAAVNVEESGIIELIANGVDIKTLDLTKLNIDKLENAIDLLFDSKMLDGIVGDGVNYVLETYLNDTLVNFTKDEDIVSKIKYESSSDIKKELLNVTSLLKSIIDAEILEAYQESNNNYVHILNSVDISDVETIINKVLSIQILSKAMPSIVNGFLVDYGLKDELTIDDNSEIADLLLDVVVLAKTLELESIEDITQGNMVDNVVNTLYVEGVLKENTIDALATLLSRVSSSRVFDDVLVTQLNKILDNLGITLNSQMIINVNTKTDWKNELIILEGICKLYKDYTTNQTVDFLTVNELISDLKNTKAMILAFPIAYKTVFPNLGIEIDPSKIVYIDYEDENALEEEVKFYNYWKDELTHLETVSVEFAKLGVTGLEDLSLDLLKIEKNEETLANIIAEVFSMDLLKKGVIEYLDKLISDMLSQYNINLNDGAITHVNSLVDTYPNYVVVDGSEYDVDTNGVYYKDGVAITISDEEILDNTLNRIWLSEIHNLSNVVNTLTGGNITEIESITTILNSVDDMKLLKDVKNDLLVFAIEQVGILETDELEELKQNKDSLDFTKEKNILINVADKLETLSGLGNLEIDKLEPSDIENIDYLLDNLLASDIFSDKVVTSLASIFNSANIIPDDSNATINEVILSVENWDEELTLIKSMLTISGADGLTEQLFTNIEDSDLLGACKYNIMIMMVNMVNDSLGEGVSKLSVPTVDNLGVVVDASSGTTQYDIEKDILLNISKVSDIEFDSLDDAKINEISPLLTNMSKSIIFDTYFSDFVNTIESSLTDANIAHDEGEDLKIIIKSVENWNSELKLINSLKNIKGTNDLTSGLFSSIENSEILGECKYNVLISMISAIGDNTLTIPTVSQLSQIVDDETQYDIEKRIILNVSKLESVDFENMDSDDIEIVSPILEDMSISVIFNNKYSEIVEQIKDSIANEEYGVTTTTNTITDWSEELTILMNIKDGMSKLEYLTGDSKDAEVIGALLENIDDSKLISKSSSQNVANKIVSNLTDGKITSVSKHENGWEYTFDTLIEQLNGGN